MLSDAVGWEASSMAVGPTPVDAAIVRCEEIRAILEGDPWAEALALQPLASLHAMRGEFATAFELLDESSAALAGFGPTVDAAVSHPEVFVAMLAGDLERAERHLRTGRRLLEQMGERAVLASTEGYLAQVCSWRDATARRTGSRGGARRSRRTTMPRHRHLAPGARARARRRGHAQRALELAREAVEIAMTTDHLNIQADALVDLAIVQEAAGAADEAETALATAVRIFETKGNVVRAREGGRLPTRPIERLTQSALWTTERGTTMAMGSRIFPHFALVNGRKTVEVKGPTGDWDPYAESATFAVIVGQVNRQTGAIVLAKGRSTETYSPQTNGGTPTRTCSIRAAASSCRAWPWPGASRR